MSVISVSFLFAFAVLRFSFPFRTFLSPFRSRPSFAFLSSIITLSSCSSFSYIIITLYWSAHYPLPLYSFILLFLFLSQFPFSSFFSFFLLLFFSSVAHAPLQSLCSPHSASLATALLDGPTQKIQHPGWSVARSDLWFPFPRSACCVCPSSLCFVFHESAKKISCIVSRITSSLWQHFYLFPVCCFGLVTCSFFFFHFFSFSSSSSSSSSLLSWS